MQTILGAGGAIGIELAKALKQFKDDIKLVSRNPKKINDTDFLFSADLTNTEDVKNAINGSQICYLTVGFEYEAKVWKEKWTKIIKDVVEACAENQTKLVFFDNVYAIGEKHIEHITENSPISPSSEKGRVRAWVDEYVIEAVEKGKIEAIIARAPDFFGAIKEKSLLMNLIYDNLSNNKTAQWLCNADVIHTTGYVPDLALGTAILGNSSKAFNQIWNLPVEQEKITGKDWINIFASKMKQSSNVQILTKADIKEYGKQDLFIAETHEMLYQYDRDYFFDSTKFNKAFGFKPTTNERAVELTLNELRRR